VNGILQKKPVVLATIQWKKIIEIAEYESMQCNDRSHLEIKHEQFIKNPDDTINKLYFWCDRSNSNKALDYLKNKNATEHER